MPLMFDVSIRRMPRWSDEWQGAGWRYPTRFSFDFNTGVYETQRRCEGGDGDGDGDGDGGGAAGREVRFALRPLWYSIDMMLTHSFEGRKEGRKASRLVGWLVGWGRAVI